MKKRVSVLGHFGTGKILLNGQTIKTKIVTEELERRLPNDVIRIDTHGGMKTLVKSPFQVLKALKTSKNVVVFPAHNGLRIYVPLLAIGRKLFKERNLHYVVIGGWLPNFLERRRVIAKFLKKFDGIYVETNTMKRALENQGFENIFLLPNCKNLDIISDEKMIYFKDSPYKLCTFSRVMREKGIEDAINAVREVNRSEGRVVYELDIFGQIESGQEQWFKDLQNDFPEYIKYCGCVNSDKSVDVLKEYFALLFPTRFYTEGIPGTIIDAYAAGVPVISAKWESYSDVVDEGVSGYGYEFLDTSALISLLKECYEYPEKILDIKKNCLQKGGAFLPDSVVDILIENLGEV